MEENILKNSLIEIDLEKPNYYINIYDIDKNIIRKELISNILCSEVKMDNFIQINKDININTFF